MFEPINLLYSSGKSKRLNIEEILNLTEYAISGGNILFRIDENLNYRGFDKDSKIIFNEKF